MATSSFQIKVGDLEPALAVTVTDQNGVAVVLSGTATAQFRWERVDDATTEQTAAAVITDAPNGLVEYQWAVGETDTAGEYQGEFIITDAGRAQTFPSRNFIKFTINDNLNTN